MSGLAPAAPRGRIEVIDTIRGFALLGIMLMNILVFGLPITALFDPTVDGATTGIDFGIFFTMELLFEGAMRTLFCMLFGAGIVMLTARGKGAAIYYKRHLILLGLGLINAFVLLWIGDILTVYAFAGMILFLARDWRPKRLFAAAGCVFAYLAICYTSLFALMSYMPGYSETVQAKLDAGEAITVVEQDMLEGWREAEEYFHPTEDLLAEQALKFEGAYPEAFSANAVELGEIYVFGLPFFLIWDSIACMLLGMALFKNGFLTGQRSQHRYLVTAILAFSIGLAVNGFELAMKIGSGYLLKWSYGPVFSYDLGRVAMGLGFASLIMLANARGYFAKLRRALAAVGRMALTNYILQSVFGLILFRDFGFGLWSELDRHELYCIVLGEWVVMVAFSVWWLRRYRFGPLEWLWRSLTYSRPQRMLA